MRSGRRHRCPANRKNPVAIISESDGLIRRTAKRSNPRNSKRSCGPVGRLWPRTLRVKLSGGTCWTWGRSMTLRALRTFGFALSVVAAVTASPPPARAVPLQIDLTINFQPPGPPEITDLTGTAQFWWLGLNASVIGPLGKQINIAALSSSPGKNSFSISFIPGDPCIGQNSCQLGFSFGGTAGGFPAYAFMLGLNDQPPGPPDSPLALKF